MTKPSQWSLDLATRLLSEAPNSVPLVEVMAAGIEAERERCAGIARDAKELRQRLYENNFASINTHKSAQAEEIEMAILCVETND